MSQAVELSLRLLMWMMVSGAVHTYLVELEPSPPKGTVISSNMYKYRTMYLYMPQP